MARKTETAGKYEKPRVVVLCKVPGCTSIASETTKSGVTSCAYHADEEHKAEIRRWLFKEGVITEHMTTPERMKAMAAYRIRIAKEDKPDPLDWARRILARMEDGENISVYQERMAKEALGVQ